MNKPKRINAIISCFITILILIQQPEIDTHLNVFGIELTAIYDGVDTNDNDDAVGQAFDLMKQTYEGDNWKGGDLHHALLGRNLGGGKAYFGQICSRSFGFGISTGITGSFQDMNSATVFDMYLFLHGKFVGTS